MVKIRCGIIKITSVVLTNKLVIELNEAQEQTIKSWVMMCLWLQAISWKTCDLECKVDSSSTALLKNITAIIRICLLTLKYCFIFSVHLGPVYMEARLAR